MGTKETYENIFIPEVDLFQKAGSRVFTHLDRAKVSEKGKNLVVLTNETYTELVKSKNHRVYAKKISDVLAVLSNNFEKDHESGNLDNFSYSLSSHSVGLDILYLRDNVKENVHELLKKSLETKKKPTHLTSDSQTKFELQTQKKPVENSKFLLGDISILQKGMLPGSPQLEERLYSSNRSLPYAKFKKYFDDELSPNTVVRFPTKYALITAPIKRDRFGKIEPVDQENLVLKLLEESEYSKKIKLGNITYEKGFRGIFARDMGQYIALQYGLLNPNVSLLFLVGGAGSGKTLLSYVAALHQVVEYQKKELEEMGWENPFGAKGIKTVAEDLENRLHKGSVAWKEKKAAIYERFILLKPDNPVGGREKGFLPGTLWSKIKPDLEPYDDAHRLSTFNDSFSFKDLVLHPKRANDYGDVRSENASKGLLGGGKLPSKKETLDVVYLGNFRGRSFENTLILIDEAQNFTPDEMKTIITRMGVGSKVVVMGDPESQIDNQALSKNYNGIVQTIEHYLPASHSMLINLGSQYRSEMAEHARSWNP